MAIWFEKIYAKIWEIKENEKYSDVRLSTSEKGKEEGKYTNSNWLGRAIGHAHQQIANGEVNAGDRVSIAKGKVTNETYTDKKTGEKKQSCRVIIFEFETNGNASVPVDGGKNIKKAIKAKPADDGNYTDEELPF